MGRIAAERRARVRCGVVTAEQLSDMMVDQGGRCFYCGIAMDMSHPRNKPASCTIDHIVPLSKGGTHEIQNIRLACKSCNSSKGDKVTRP